MKRLMIALALVVVQPAAAQPVRQPTPSEKLASELMGSRTCEVVPENGYTACHYRAQGLHFVHRTLPKRSMTWVDVEQINGPATVSFSGSGPCLVIQISAVDPEQVAGVQFNVNTGKFYLDGRDGGCYPKSKRAK